MNSVEIYEYENLIDLVSELLLEYMLSDGKGVE